MYIDKVELQFKQLKIRFRGQSHKLMELFCDLLDINHNQQWCI